MKKNKIQIIITIIINLLPWLVLYIAVNSPSLYNPLDPEGLAVQMLFAQMVIFLLWLCWFIYLLTLYYKNKISLFLVGIINIPYIVFYGYGDLSIINILLLPLTIFISRDMITNPPYEEEVLILINILSWILLLFVIHRRRIKKMKQEDNA